MSQKIIDYTLGTLTPANPDASLPATVTGAAVVAGPGATTLGTYAQALAFGAGGKLEVALPVAALDRTKFCARVVFKVDTAVAARQSLAGSSALPFELYLVPGSGSSDFHLVAAVTSAGHGVVSASTEFFLDLKLATWYAADLVYDTDTLAVFVDGVIYSVHALPNGTLANGTGDKLTTGSGVSLAALQLHADLPIELESQLDERRAHPQWHLTYKQEEVAALLGFGAPAGEFVYDVASGAWIQDFAAGLIMYHDSNGQAFEMHGAILQAYRAHPARATLGYLISDEVNGTKSGSRKSLFNRGGFYWSAATGAVPVTGQIWVDYESQGEGAALGLPLSAATAIGGGWQQIFQTARMYWKSANAKAFEVHGAILAKFLATGATAAWGFPVTNEQDVKNGAATIGRSSEFERCTIYWSAGSGAYEVHGDIRERYRSVAGPAGVLGFPTSDEADVPGAAAPARYNSFQKGSIVWFGSAAQTYTCLAFDIRLGRVNTKESEGWLRGENDVYMYATIEDNGHTIHHERIPGSGELGGGNNNAIDKTFDVGPAGIVPNSANRVIRFGLDVWDSDWPDDDDHLGEFEYTLSIANAWGLKDNPGGLFNSGSFDNINYIAWAVVPRIDERLLVEPQKWWGVTNQGTNPITYDQYASAFSDVDSEREWWDPTDWLAKLFYEAVCSGIASSGNCFGMSLEAIYSKKHRSLMTLPLDRFTAWEPVRNEFNIKHQYQVGAPAIWWFVGEFLSGNTHDPVDVFRETRAKFNAGCDPVICIAQNYDFSGAPHCILPIGWDDSVKPWQMKIRDPNFPSTGVGDAGPRILYVDPDANTFTYDGSSHYSGGEWSGGRLHYMPYELVCERPRTPIFEALMLLISGVILILGSDGETTSLTDENGVDLDAFGADSVARLQSGAPLTHKFVSVKGFDSHTRDCAKERTGPKPQGPKGERRPRPHGVLTSEVHMRSEPKRFSRAAPPNKRGGDDWTRVTLKEYLCQLAPAEIRALFAKQPRYVVENQGRLMHRLVATDAMRKIVGAAATKTPDPANRFPAITQNFIHTTRSLRGGRLEYGLKQGMGQMLLTADAAAGETHEFHVKDLGTHTNSISVKGARDKIFSLVVHHRLGVGNDHLRMTIDRLPLAAGGELTINVKPGIGGVEVIANGQEIEATIAFDYVRGRDSLSSQFQVSEKGGVRIAPSTFITQNRLKVSRIDTLFGDSLGSVMLPAMP